MTTETIERKEPKAGTKAAKALEIYRSFLEHNVTRKDVITNIAFNMEVSEKRAAELYNGAKRRHEGK